MRILDGRESFYQWDLNQKITSNSFRVGDEIHFSNMKLPTALVVIAYELEGKVVADVPNILLQSSLPITVYRYINEKGLEHTVQQHTFNVIQRAKPDDYIYTETEILSIKSVVNEALREAKESGEFDGEKGEDGYTPQKGIDYYTEEDKAEIVDEVMKDIGDIGEDVIKDNILLKDTETGKTHKIYVTNGKLTMEVSE